MIRSNISVIAVISLAVVVTNCLAQSLSYDERCEVVEGNGFRVDQCDAKKYLTCNSGRCQCADPVNQIYTSRSDIVYTRNKRSPGKKGGGAKKVAAGFVAGAAVVGVAHVASNAANNNNNGYGYSTKTQKQRYQTVRACYSRVGGQCSLNYNNVESISSVSNTNATTTTTAAPGNSTQTTFNSTEAPGNSTETTTIAAPHAAAQVSKLDISKLPQCVQYARCKSVGPPTGNNGTSANSEFLKKVEYDPRVGVCECQPGYAKNSKDLCDKSGAGKSVAGASLAVILATLVMNKIFV